MTGDLGDVPQTCRTGAGGRNPSAFDHASFILFTQCWSAHQLLQVCLQPFLFSSANEWYGGYLCGSSAMVGLIGVQLLVFRRSKAWFALTIVMRNIARALQCPFLWDSEYWLALTDLSLLVSMLISSQKKATSMEEPLGLASIWTRQQMAICYAAAAFFKLNTSFLDVRTSCAPIFALSLAEYLLPTAVLDIGIIVQAGAQAAPLAVILLEAGIGGLLWNRRYHKVGVGLALLFHLLIAITPFPNGVPTFSCVAASRLLLVIGADGGRSAVKGIQLLFDNRNGVMIALVIFFLSVLAQKVTNCDHAIIFYFIVCALCVSALCSDSLKDLHDSDERENTPIFRRPEETTKHRYVTTLLVGLAMFYAFIPPILGLQEIGSNTMFGNVRLHGGTNHLLGVPTGLLQAWYYNESALPSDSPAQDWFGGGIVRVEYTNSVHLNQLYPGEITSLLSPTLRSHLQNEKVGHIARQFNPKARRVLGVSYRLRMPQWSVISTTPYVQYTVPALEFRRLVAEAREHARESGVPFDLYFTRLKGATGDEHWRKHSRNGVTIRLQSDDGFGGGTCTYRPNRNHTDEMWTRPRQMRDSKKFRPCPDAEVAFLSTPPRKWALKFMLFYPYAIMSGQGNDGSVSGADELVCNY